MIIPKKEHWAIISINRIVIPGDQRSKDHPGHGYPEHTEETVSYEVFNTEEEMTVALTKRHQWSDMYSVVGVHVDTVFTAEKTTRIVMAKNGT